MLNSISAEQSTSNPRSGENQVRIPAERKQFGGKSLKLLKQTLIEINPESYSDLELLSHANEAAKSKGKSFHLLRPGPGANPIKLFTP